MADPAAPANEGTPASETVSLQAQLGLLSAITLIVGSSIGSGIFLLPSSMAQQLPAPGLFMLAWVVCGLLSIFGALTFAEMGAMFPRAGGQYVFIREAWGETVAYLYGWTFLVVINTGTIAAVGYAFALYVAYFFPMSAVAVKLVAIAAILGLSAVNYVGVKYGGFVQNLFTILKVAALAALIVAGFALGGARGSITTPFAPAGTAVGPIVGAFGLAMTAALFAYDGWNQATFVASEIRDPQRTIPRAMVIAVGVVMTVYLGANAVYLHVLPIAEVASSHALAADVARVLVGPVGASLIAAAILASTFGTVNAYVLATPRVAYAMAVDGVLYKGFGSLHRRFLTPDFATLIVAEFSCLLVLTGTYNDLVNIAVFGIWASYVVTGLALFRFRRTLPGAARPYRTTGYPVVPALFVMAGLFIVGNELLNDRRNALICVGLIALGGIVFLGEKAVKRFAKRRRTMLRVR